MKRRDFIRLSAAAAGMVAPIGRRGFAASAQVPSGKRLVVVFLRGAVDGLNVVVPYGEPAYYDARPTIAIQPPGKPDGALDLDGRFGLHPALAPLMPFWKDRSLAFVHATGSTDPNRSHFDAQDYMESGTPGQKDTPDGWMNRTLSHLSGAADSSAALSFGPVLPRILQGPQAVATIPTGRAAERPIPLDRPIINAAFDPMYQGDDAMSRAYRDGLAQRQKLTADLILDMKEADNGAPSPAGFESDTGHLIRLIERTPSVELAFFALGGWDTHVGQGGAAGQLANHLAPLAEGLAALATGLKSAYRDTTIVVISEFGRTVHENGDRGTDHGHGTVFWVMGGPIAGGRVYGDWPGLEEDQLYQQRDLAITTDFRVPLAVLLRDHMSLRPQSIASVFPGMPAPGAAVSGLVRT
jgi:uncharacterized protein (DUF1501 family)